jgi:hypothetical protein
MTYRQWWAARQLLAEEFLGKFARQPDRAEDAAFAASLSRLPR